MLTANDVHHDSFVEAWRISDPLRRLIYNLLRCPRELWEMLKDMYNNSKPEHAAILESLCQP